MDECPLNDSWQAILATSQTSLGKWAPLAPAVTLRTNNIKPFFSFSNLNFFFLTYIFYWSIVDLQSFRCTARWFSYTHVKVKVAQSCLTCFDPMDCTVPGILQARILEWVAFPFSRGFSQPRERTQVSGIAGEFFTNWVIRKVHIHIYYFSDYFPLYVITRYWSQFPVLYSKPLLLVAHLFFKIEI